MDFTKIKTYCISGLTESDMAKLRRTLRKTYIETPDTNTDYTFLVEFLTKLDNIVIKN
ncbi:MAG: hypothetical protein M0R51_05895 [Clostridia bacterium]|jgi:hypothetical protein|nr:hypothetical protein [Clostridia bacterium]